MPNLCDSIFDTSGLQVQRACEPLSLMTSLLLCGSLIPASSPACSLVLITSEKDLALTESNLPCYSLGQIPVLIAFAVTLTKHLIYAA